MVAHRPDWTLSRQRVWGVPIVAFYCVGCEGLLLEQAVVDHVARIFGEGRGIDEWHVRAEAELLPPGTRCAQCGGTQFRKETDIARRVVRLRLQPRGRAGDAARAPLAGGAVPRGLGPASRLVPQLAAGGDGDARRAPYRTVLTCGFVVDGEGKKMSKSGGNAVKPDESIAKYGAEVLRLWVAAEDYTEDIRLSSEIIDRLADAYRRIRNTFRFLLGNLADFDPARDRQPYERLDEVDRWVLDRLARLIDRVGHAYEEYQFHTVFHSVHNFCAVDLSAQYLDIIKDRLYTSAPTTRGAAPPQTACADILGALLRLMAPILSFTTEEAWRHAPGARGESVHLERFPEVPLEWLDERLKSEWDRLLEVRREVAKALETARGRKLIGSGLEAAIRIVSAPEDLPALFATKRSSSRRCSSSRAWSSSGPATGAVVYESQEIPGLVVAVDRAPGRKCERCWTWSERVGEDANHPALCERCVPAVAGR